MISESGSAIKAKRLDKLALKQMQHQQSAVTMMGAVEEYEETKVEVMPQSK